MDVSKGRVVWDFERLQHQPFDYHFALAKCPLWEFLTIPPLLKTKGRLAESPLLITVYYLLFF